MKIELIYDRDCPNVDGARGQLRRALADCGVKESWIEWDRGDEKSPPQVRRYGSPSVLVNGNDVAGAAPSEGADCCRLYQGADGYRGAPSADVIALALRKACCGHTRSGRLRGALAMIPPIVVASLPNLACPACWPAYAGVLSSLGLSFLLRETYLLPLTVAFLLLALTVLAIGARRRQGFGPFVVGVAASALLLTAKFFLKADWPMYAGVGLLVAASLWNVWPARRKPSADCPACSSDSSKRSNS